MGGLKMTILKKVFGRKPKKQKQQQPRYLDPSGTALNAWRTL
jgi:hypothetical protein